MTAKNHWKKGRGKLGLFDPLIGNWMAHSDSPNGAVECTRSFSRSLHDKYVHLSALWNIPNGIYEESAYIGVDGDDLAFWSFTSDGKHSQGRLADVTDVHPQAVGFEAQMPAGLARMVYWPDEADGFHWVVDQKLKKAGTASSITTTTPQSNFHRDPGFDGILESVNAISRNPPETALTKEFE